MQTPHLVHWFEIYVDDMPRAKQFYESVFEITLTQLDSKMDMEMWVFPAEEGASGATGALAKMDGVKSGNNSTLIYFSSQDCDITSQRVIDAGGKVVHPKFSIGEHGFIAIAVDTEGNTIGLHSIN